MWNNERKRIVCKKNKKLINPVMEYPPKPYNFYIILPMCASCAATYSDNGRRTKNQYPSIPIPKHLNSVFFNFTYRRAINGRVNSRRSNPLALISACNRFENILVQRRDVIPIII